MESLHKRLYLFNLSEEVRSILDDTNMGKVFAIVNSLDDLEKEILTNVYGLYLPYTREEGGVRRLHCSCAVCGSRDVVGYLLNPNTIDFRWIEDDPFPVAFDRESNKPVEYFSLLPVVCNECFMASIRLADFNVIHDNAVVIKSGINDKSKNLLTKSIKKRKKMMDLGLVYGDNFFEHTRDTLAVYKAYELAEFCARTISVTKKGATHFDVGYLDYLAIQYAEPGMKEIHINHSRTWFTQAMSKPEVLSTFELAVIHFVLIVANLNLGKKKEAADLYTDFGILNKNMPSTVPAEGFTSPAFWYKQVEVIWKKEIEVQSEAIKVKTR
jgi:hypothetical protein